MKLLVFARPRTEANSPPESALALFQQTNDWVNAHMADGTLDSAHNLPAGGGVAILNANSHETRTKLLSSYPLQPWVAYVVHPLSDVKHAFDLTIKALGG